MQVEWLATALDDRAAIFNYLLDRNPHAAAAVSEALALAGDSLATFPYRGRPGLARGTRELVTVLPYLLVYEVDAAAEVVRILRIWHGAQDR
jgi:addiction module RelE/StbE family toxin